MTTIVSATTLEITVSAEPHYLEHESFPDKDRYVFAYQIRIKNESKQTVQLRNRHWIITDSNGEISHVRGAGVVGKQPILDPGEEYEYISGSQLKSPLGTMQGTYQMENEMGEPFDIEIPVFTLSVPGIMN